MQYSLNIGLPDTFALGYTEDPEQALLDLLVGQEEKIAFMLQGYHSREKVRHVDFVQGSLQIKEDGQGSLTVVYQLEEFNVCSNIDSVDSEKMTLSYLINESTQILELKGIDIPEREPDSFD
ncbi:hypothetical protein [Pedobacter gandavensis]|uniref:hypothetical protein n=1 Tax=Pedobacter gandavensis TaxID=2679963 RepID=UPI00292EFA42|nr:hypothetical protein [Pedobacter gandavensis]